MKTLEERLADIESRLATLEQHYKDQAKTKRPSNVEEVMGYCATVGLEDKDAVWFWDKMEAQGWRNNGRPVASWKATIRVWNGMAIFPSQKSTNRSPAICLDELKRVDARIKQIRDSYDSHQSPSKEDSEELWNLRRRQKELKNQLGYKV